MKKSILLLPFFALFFLNAIAQSNSNAIDGLFKLYADSSSLAFDAAPMVSDFNDRVNRIRPELDYNVGFVVYTTPGLVYYAPVSRNVITSLYHELPEESLTFFQYIHR